MKALTLHQPWAHAIFHEGKSIENRSWSPPEDLMDQWFAIHAGQTFDRELPRHMQHITPDDVEFGAILGIVRLVGVVSASRSKWFYGPVGWVIADAHMLPSPIMCGGKLKLWRVPPAALGKMRKSFPKLKLE